jgi:hypothetical protein
MWKKIKEWFRGKNSRTIAEPTAEPTETIVSVSSPDMTITRGMVIGGGGPPPSGFIVDEVANESLVQDHPDVIWYQPTESLLGASPADGTGWWFTGRNPTTNPNWFQWVAGWDGNEDEPIVSVPGYGVNAIRWGVSTRGIKPTPRRFVLGEST